MNILLLLLIGLSGIFAIYGVVRIGLLYRKYVDRRRSFEHRLEGRRTERRDSERRSMLDLRHARSPENLSPG